MISKVNKASSLRFSYIVMLFTLLIYIYTYLISIKYDRIPHFLFVTGGGMLYFMLIDLLQRRVSLTVAISKEIALWVGFISFTFITGLIKSPSVSSHISMSITSFEYLALSLCIVAVFYFSDDCNKCIDKYINVLIFVALFAALLYINDPRTLSSGRYVTIGENANATSYSQIFIYAIWAVTYRIATKRKLNLWLGIPMISLFLYCIIISGSRKSLLSFVILIIAWLLFCYIPSQRKSSKFRWILFSILFGIALYYMYINFYINSNLALRMVSFSETIDESARYDMYIYGWNLFLKNPILGEGFWSFNYHYGNYSHNAIIEVLVSGGIVGFLLYFGAYYVSFRKIFLYMKMTKNNPWMRDDYILLKQTLILLVIMTFNSVSIVHIHKLDSYFMFGVLFGIVHIFDKRLRVKHTASQAVFKVVLNGGISNVKNDKGCYHFTKKTHTNGNI